MGEKEYIGKSMRELSMEELSDMYGAADNTAEPMSTVLCSVGFKYIIGIISKSD